jgi:hypothetical protein
MAGGMAAVTACCGVICIAVSACAVLLPSLGDGLTATADVVPRQDGEIELPAQVVPAPSPHTNGLIMPGMITTATRAQLPITSSG